MDIMVALVNSLPDAVRMVVMFTLDYATLFIENGYTVFEDGSIIP